MAAKPDEKWGLEDGFVPVSGMSAPISEVGKLGSVNSDGVDNLNYLIQPFTKINETKDLLHKLGTVHIVRKQMIFSDPEFEQRYIDYLEPRIRSRLFLLGVSSSIYAVYSMFLYGVLSSGGSPLIYSWKTVANTLYNITWICIAFTGVLMVVVSRKTTVFQHSVENFAQYSCTITLVAGIMLGNLWRVTRITRVDFTNAFPVKICEHMYPDSDLVMMLSAFVLYLAVVAEMRFRRLVWLAVISYVFYTFTVVYYRLPDYTTAMAWEKAGLPGMARMAAAAPSTTAPPVITSVANVEGEGAIAPEPGDKTDPPPNTRKYLDVPESEARQQTWMLAAQLLCLFLIGMFGKVQLELLQRQNFLELELAAKRIEVLEKTINAIDNDSQPHTQLEQTHKRLKAAERIIEKVRLMGMSTADGGAANNNYMRELQTVLDVLRETEKTMTIMDFQKEVLIGPMKNGHEYKEEEVMNWIQTVVNMQNSVAEDTTGGGRGATSLPSLMSMQSFATDLDLGISAKSLMKRIGVEWSLDLGELERTLKENRSADLNPFCLTARAILTPFLNNVLMGITPDVLGGFAKAVNDAYLDIPFHNADHGALVCHHATILLEVTGVRKHLGGIDRLAMAVAALCHNVSHFGRSNAFLIETKHELALRYNDASVLENFHAAKTFEIIRSSKRTNITAALSKRDEQRFRSRVVQLILATDNSHHFTLCSELRMRLMGSAMFADPVMMEADKRIGMVAVIKAAYYGCFAMPVDLQTQWMERLAEELAQQGADEKALGFPISPMCDRESQELPSMTIGIMNLLVMPMYDELFNFVKNCNPGMAEAKMGGICSTLINNHSHWEAVRRVADSTPGGAGRGQSESFDIFIPIPKERSATTGSDTVAIDGMEASSPPNLVPIEHQLEVSPMDRHQDFLPSGPISAAESRQSDSDDEGPPMLPFNQMHK